MKILRPAWSRRDVYAPQECLNCHAIFELDREDVDKEADDDGEGNLYCHCPSCAKAVLLNAYTISARPGQEQAQ